MPPRQGVCEPGWHCQSWFKPISQWVKPLRGREGKGHRCKCVCVRGQRSVGFVYFMCQRKSATDLLYNERNEWYILYYPITTALLDPTFFSAAIRVQRVTLTWLRIHHTNIIADLQANTPEVNPSHGCCILLLNQHSSAHTEADEWMHPPPRWTTERKAELRDGEQRWKQNQNEKWRREKQVKRKTIWIKERGERPCGERWWNGDCLLLANGWPGGLCENGMCS